MAPPSAEGEECEAVWARGRQMYVGYQVFPRRVNHRPIHGMVLEPTAAG